LITKAKFKAKMRKKGQEVLQLMTSKKLSWGLGVCGDCTYISLQLLVLWWACHVSEDFNKPWNLQVTDIIGSCESFKKQYHRFPESVLSVVLFVSGPPVYLELFKVLPSTLFPNNCSLYQDALGSGDDIKGWGIMKSLRREILVVTFHFGL
jgi:hypothetical protein